MVDSTEEFEKLVSARILEHRNVSDAAQTDRPQRSGSDGVQRLAPEQRVTGRIVRAATQKTAA